MLLNCCLANVVSVPVASSDWVVGAKVAFGDREEAYILLVHRAPIEQARKDVLCSDAPCDRSIGVAGR